MDKFSAINFAVAGVVSFVIAASAIVAAITPPAKESIFRLLDPVQYPGTAWTLRLWGVWWMAMFFTYLGIDKLPYGYALAMSNLGDLFTLGAAVTYCTAVPPNKKLIVFLGGVFTLELIWDVAMPVFFNSPQGRVIIIAPSVVISSISIVALGWAVVVRCGWTALSFLLLTSLYSLAQLPAYFAKIVLRDAGEDLTKHFDGLYLAFVFLAIGKVIYALAFFGYFFSPMHDFEELKKYKYLPSEATEVKMHPKFAKFFQWIVVILTSFLAAIVAATAPGFTEWVKKIFNLH